MRRPRFSSVVVLSMLLAAAHPARAETWDWRELGFGLRLPLALDRASVFTDVAGLSASAAYPYGSSVNPANDDFLRTPPNQFTLAGTATGVWVPFDSGASITASAWSLSYRLPTAGTFSFSYSRSESHNAHSHQGDTYRLQSQDFSLGYSHLVTSDIALGGEFRVTDSWLKFESTSEGFPLNANSDSLGYDARLGMTFAVTKQFLVGVTAGAGWTYTHNNAQVEVPVAFGGPVNVGRFYDVTRSVSARTGIGWRPSDAFGLYGDVQYLRLKNDDESVSVGRAFAGIEYLPIQALALRVGGSVDSVGKTTVSTGIGIYAFKHVQIELAYSYNAFPEVRREFGVAHLVSFSIVGLY